MLLTLSLTVILMPVWLRTSAIFSKNLVRQYHQNFGSLRTLQLDKKVRVKIDGTRAAMVVEDHTKTRGMLSSLANSVIIAET